MPKPQKDKKDSIVKPLIHVDGEEHPFEKLFLGEGKRAPILKSIGYAKIEGGFVSYVITSRGPHVLGIEVSEPDLRPIAEDSTKVNFVNLFMNVEV